MDTSKFNTVDSLKTIEAAFNETKTAKTGASFYYILWGIVLFLYFSLQFTISKNPVLKGSLLHTFSWVLFPIGGIFSYLNKSKEQEKESYVPFFERVYFWAFTAFACLYGVLTFASAYLSSPLMIMLFPSIIGATVYTVGGITKHKASIIGGIIGIVFSFLSVLSATDFQYLIAALACISTCIIPGISMRKSNV
jgi:hypothetical protein